MLHNTLETLFGHLGLVDGGNFAHELLHLILQQLGCMGLVNVVQDLPLEWSRQLQIQHCRIGQIDLLRQLLGSTLKLINILGHVTNNHGINDGAT